MSFGGLRHFDRELSPLCVSAKTLHFCIFKTDQKVLSKRHKVPDSVPQDELATFAQQVSLQLKRQACQAMGCQLKAAHGCVSLQAESSSRLCVFPAKLEAARCARATAYQHAGRRKITSPVTPTCASPIVSRSRGWGARSIFIGTQDDIANR